MKKIFLFAAIAATLGFVSCNKNQHVEPVDDVEQNTGMLFVNLAPVNGNETKADKTTLEGMQSTIRSIQVFVFSAETNPSLGLVADQIETSKFIYGNDISNTTSGVTKGNAIALTTYLGKKKIIALVNAPRQEGVTTVTELLGRVSNLSENYIAETSVGTPAIARQGMVMAGAYGYEYTVEPVSGVGNGINITPDILDVVKKYDRKDDSSIYGITIPVYRLGARIEVGTVTVNFNDTDMRGTTLTIKDIKLKNVMTTVTFGGGLTSELINGDTNWDMKLATTGSNAGTYRSGVADKLQDTDLSIQCNEGVAAPVNKSYIVYPNYSGDPAGLQTVGGSATNMWSPRRTRLVIHALLTGGGRATPEDTFYSFSIADPANIKEGQANNGTFSQIVGNRRYVIDNINITMKGKPNDNDDMLPATGRVSATVEVKDWSGETLLSYEM